MENVEFDYNVVSKAIEQKKSFSIFLNDSKINFTFLNSEENKWRKIFEKTKTKEIKILNFQFFKFSKSIKKENCSQNNKWASV